jgi:predicted DCC family thiol-disulfide oxidoreductase YuxK
VSAIILFDGECAFCEGAVRFIAARDGGRFQFGASQSPQAAALLASHGVTRESTRSIILIEDGQLYLRSTASLQIASQLTAPWRWARVLLAVPRPIRDTAYNMVAAVRRRIAGVSNACEVPPPEIRARMI